MPLVSVITPVYNAAQWLPEMIVSVQEQTLIDWELFLVDDGSTDSSASIAKNAAIKDSRIKVLQMPYNCGPAAARNTALNIAQGRFIAFLDADDLWLPEKLTRCIEFMNIYKYGFIYHGYRYMAANKSCVGKLIFGPQELNFRTLHTCRGIPIHSVVIDRKLIINFKIPQGYFEYMHEDFIMWLDVIRSGYVGHLFPLDLCRYRIVPKSLGAKKINAARKVWKIYREISRLSFITSVIWWSKYAWNSFWLHRNSLPKNVRVL
jgi:teichuronic acid biosynthesis glycosyltransferase TuaG